MLALAAPALATDGAREINQACAENTGCFGGDDPGFPVLLTSPGSYVLTSNLSVADADTDGISVVADGVAIDLNGFEVAGPGTCTGSPAVLSCSGGTGRGITSQNRQTQVRRGTVRGFGSWGIRLLVGSIAENLTAKMNGFAGISVYRGTVIGCTASTNGGAGIVAEQSSVTGSEAVDNRRVGISVGSGSVNGSVSTGNGEYGFTADRGTLHDNVASSNVVDGIRCGSSLELLGGCVITANSVSYNGAAGVAGDDAVVITGNSVSHNGAAGIVGNDAVVARNNTVSENQGDGITLRFSANVDGNTVFKNSGNGISVNSSSRVASNSMRANAEFGIFFLGSQSAYRDNTISVNTGGTVGFGVGNTAVDTGQNLCNGLQTCP
jgi:parallel beta-helix repeat protein